MIRYLAVSALIMTLGVGTAAANDDKRPEVGEIGKAYRGQEGLELRVLRYGKESKNEVILEYSGIDHKWNHKIWKAKVVNAGNGQDYVIEVDGKPYSTVVMRRGWGDSNSYEVYLPNGPKGMKVFYDSEMSKDMVPQHFLTAYLKQIGVEK